MKRAVIANHFICLAVVTELAYFNNAAKANKQSGNDKVSLQACPKTAMLVGVHAFSIATVAAMPGLPVNIMTI